MAPTSARVAWLSSAVGNAVPIWIDKNWLWATWYDKRFARERAEIDLSAAGGVCRARSDLLKPHTNLHLAYFISYLLSKFVKAPLVLL
jgi:hypothetical protein